MKYAVLIAHSFESAGAGAETTIYDGRLEPKLDARNACEVACDFTITSSKDELE